MRGAVLIFLACSNADDCKQGSRCTTGHAVNVSNATGACVHNPFYPQTKVCEVCSDCHKQWPSCPCCATVYDEANACAMCLVDSEYSLQHCGNLPVSYDCDKTQEEDACVAKPGTGGMYPTKADCTAKCSFRYDCLAKPSYACQKSATGRFNLSECHAQCHAPGPAPTPKPAPTPPPAPVPCIGKSERLAIGDCKIWQKAFDTWGGTDWKHCADSRADPCGCSWEDTTVGGVTCFGLQHTTTIRAIVLPNIRITGTIPSQIWQFSALVSLQLNDNGLTGTIPVELSNSRALNIISLYGNHLTGRVPSFPRFINPVDNACCLTTSISPSGNSKSNHNHFRCPLPSNAWKCTCGESGGPTISGVTCDNTSTTAEIRDQRTAGNELVY
jgi:hypothetical protein